MHSAWAHRELLGLTPSIEGGTGSPRPHVLLPAPPPRLDRKSSSPASPSGETLSPTGAAAAPPPSARTALPARPGSGKAHRAVGAADRDGTVLHRLTGRPSRLQLPSSACRKTTRAGSSAKRGRSWGFRGTLCAYIPQGLGEPKEDGFLARRQKVINPVRVFDQRRIAVRVVGRQPITQRVRHILLHDELSGQSAQPRGRDLHREGDRCRQRTACADHSCTGRPEAAIGSGCPPRSWRPGRRGKVYSLRRSAVVW